MARDAKPRRPWPAPGAARDVATTLAIDLAAATALLTRAPLPASWDLSQRPRAAAAWAYPLVGLAIGALSGGCFWGASAIGAAPMVAAALALMAEARATGGLHYDGLADAADGFGAGRDPARVVEIMRDSRIGAYGVTALCLAILVQAAALAALDPISGATALIVAGAASRAAMAAAMTTTGPARGDGFAASVGRPSRAACLGAVAIAVLAAVAAGGPGLVALAAVCVVGALTAWKAARRLGGVTGDVLGAIQTLTAAAALAAFGAAM